MLGTLCDLLYSLAVNMTGWKKIEMSWRKKQHPPRPNCRVSCLFLGPLLTQTVLFHMRVRVKTLFDGSGAACLFPPSDMVSRAFNYKHNVGLWPCSFTLARGHCRLLQHRQGFGCQYWPFQKCTLAWFSDAFLEEWGTTALCIFTPFSISKETNTHIRIVKDLTALSLQGQVHVVTATECGGQQDQNAPWK